MKEAKFYRRYKFAVVEYYNLSNWYFSISIGLFELQFNKWPG